MKNALAGLALLTLCACQPQAPDGDPAPPPADAPPAAEVPAPATVMDISKPITARGTEPFWALTIDGTTLKLTRPDHADLVAQAPGAAIDGGRAVWIAKGSGGEQLTVTLYASACSDGMSDLKYPMSAEVAVVNETLQGCAAKTAELPREGG